MTISTEKWELMRAPMFKVEEWAMGKSWETMKKFQFAVHTVFFASTT